MDAIRDAYIAGWMISGLTWGTLKIIWKYAIKGGDYD